MTPLELHPSKKRPANEAMRRLQLELPFLRTPAANEGGAAPSPPLAKPPGKRGPKRRRRHGRPKLPVHLPRVAEVHRLPDAERTCPTCQVSLLCEADARDGEVDLCPIESSLRSIPSPPLCRGRSGALRALRPRAVRARCAQRMDTAATRAALARAAAPRARP